MLASLLPVHYCSEDEAVAYLAAGFWLCTLVAVCFCNSLLWTLHTLLQTKR